MIYSKMKENIGKVIIVILSISIFGLLLYISTIFKPEEITTYISQAGIYAPLIYISVQILGQIFAPLSTSALFVAGYMLFGRVAILYSIIVWSISSITNFYISRKYGKNVLTFFLGKKGVEDVEKMTNDLTDGNLFFLRLVTFNINDFASYAFGLTNISFKKYLIATLVSMLPWSIIMHLLYQEGETLLIITLKIFLSMIPFTILSWWFFKYRKR
jgi:uncharacterized membrane protein YdjX (TVP38/TMEM64 family)